jgi:hypothetical protein
MNGVSTEVLFSYGTLRGADVQRAIFGRRLSGAPDTLVGYVQATVRVTDPGVLVTSGQADHPILCRSDDPTDIVQGMALRLTPLELVQADAYEVDDYQRVRVTLGSGLSAWVYVQAVRSPA